MLRNFRQNEDQEEKLIVVSAREDGFVDGFWPEKDEMSQAYARRATGDWLWQVDSDEFYRSGDIRKILDMLGSNPEISSVSFPFYEFWGGFNYLADGPWFRYEFKQVPRIFRWRPSYRYVSHRPPTVLDRDGYLLAGRQVNGDELAQQNIFMYHYSYVLPKQAKLKVGYYSNVSWTDAFQQNQTWLEEEYWGLKHPMFLGDRDSTGFQWLRRFHGKHPEGIEQLRQDLNAGQIKEPLRPTEDIERLLTSPVYSIEKNLASLFLFFYWPIRVVWKKLRSKILAVLRPILGAKVL